MYRLTLKELVSHRLTCFWSLLAFLAGFLNSIGFLACGRFVSYVTGFSTQLGVALGHGEDFLAIKALAAPFSF